ncbi:protein D3 [Tribolium castaneum]|uniref:Odorant-binding protein A5-like Protein n=1 Tax=Tribolium castaneum TaxID=7070 RepID=D6WLP9_TRICA|nr:PREDICTED: protein D3 [Tribolium castaneum]EFA03423.1 Putative odorant-binding protein A5-like Protein [Tribolium castaneum]|eukprot:XP_972580.1 PREDICTED: protein D3 [Tribolium castaneum]
MNTTDVVDAVDTAPSAKITITYPGGRTVEFGKELKPEEVKDEPQVCWDAAPDKYYTLLMFDPDAPSRMEPKIADVKHWLVVNIQGCEVKTGEVIAEYMGSGAPQGTGLHRYIFLVFEQKGKMQFKEPKSGKLDKEHRISWSMRKFRRENELGEAYAGNYFVAQWSPFVDEWRKQWEMAANSRGN